MARKTAKAPREPETMIRVSKRCAAAISEVAQLEKMTSAEWLEAKVLPLAQKEYRETFLKKAKQMERSGP